MELLSYIFNLTSLASLSLAEKGPSGLIQIVSIVCVLGILVFVHEFGHYAVAKLCGVRVEIFSLGFGKRLWGFRRGDTDYRISALPLGGYVKMAGENPMEDRTGDPGEFTSHPRWQRFLIAIAGPAANIILAVAVLTAVFMVHHETAIFWDEPAVIGWVNEGSAAEKAGLHAGDKITRIHNESNPTWAKAIYQIALNPDQAVDLDIQRGSETLHKTIVPATVGRDRLGSAGWVPQGPALVSRVEAGMPAAKAGVQLDDEIVAVNGSPSALALSAVLEQNKGKPIELSLLRNGQPLTLTMTPVNAEDSENPGHQRYRIGVLIAEMTRVDKLPFPEALSRSVDECKTNSGLVFELLGKVLSGKASVKQFSSPVGMAKATGEAAKEGLTPLLGLGALISLQLALFNLLPIPILDGGLMLMLLIEGVIRRDIKQEIKERVYQAAFVFLMLFAAVVIYNDVIKQLHG
jgi:regulator of sigma E protease